MVGKILLAYVTLRGLWVALMVLYGLFGDRLLGLLPRLRSRVKALFLWVGLIGLARLFEGLGINLMSGAVLLAMVAALLPSGSVMELKDTYALKAGGSLGFVLWLVSVWLNKKATRGS